MTDTKAKNVVINNDINYLDIWCKAMSGSVLTAKEYRHALATLNINRHALATLNINQLLK